jgi:hypothetical protein
MRERGWNLTWRVVRRRLNEEADRAATEGVQWAAARRATGMQRRPRGWTGTDACTFLLQVGPTVLAQPAISLPALQAVRLAAAAESGRAMAALEAPIQRVAMLLQEAGAQLDEEATDDSVAYDRLACWFGTSDKAKNAAIAEAETNSEGLRSEVGTRSGRGGELQTQIEPTMTDLPVKKEALASGLAIREKAITTLKNAISVLCMHNAGLLPVGAAVQESVGSALRWAALGHGEMLELDVEGAGQRDCRPAAAGPRLRPRCCS